MVVTLDTLKAVFAAPLNLELVILPWQSLAEKDTRALMCGIRGTAPGKYLICIQRIEGATGWLILGDDGKDREYCKVTLESKRHVKPLAVNIVCAKGTQLGAIRVAAQVSSSFFFFALS